MVPQAQLCCAPGAPVCTPGVRVKTPSLCFLGFILHQTFDASHPSLHAQHIRISTRDVGLTQVNKTGRDAAYALFVSYFYSDWWLWVLHCFLDRTENLKSAVSFIRSAAHDFQDHHSKPRSILRENHLGTTDDLISVSCAITLLLGLWTPATWKLIVDGVALWGSVAALNHVFCHALNGGMKVPFFFVLAQAWGLLPSAKHHKTHHTPPFQENWNFLVGFHQVYQLLYKCTGSSYAVVAAAFWLTNPAVAQLLILAVQYLLSLSF